MDNLKVHHIINNNDLKISCPLHYSQLVKFICLENSCQKKLICQTCFDELGNIDNHKLVTILEYFKGMQNFIEMPENTENFQQPIMQIIEGQSLIKKKEYFVSQAEIVKDQLREEHVHNIKIQMDRFKAEVDVQIQQAREHIIQSYEAKLQEQFSNHSLKCKEYKDRGCKIILSSVKCCQSKEINSNLAKLHQGKYEICFAKEQMFNIYSEINNKMENMIGQNLRQIKEHMEEFTHFFGNVEKKQNILDTLKKSPLIQQKLSVSMLKSQNQKEYQLPSELLEKPLGIGQLPSTPKNNTPRKFLIKNISQANNNNNSYQQPNSQRDRGDLSERDLLEKNIFIPNQIRQKLHHHSTYDFRSDRQFNSAHVIDSPYTPHQYQGSLFASFLKRDQQMHQNEKNNVDSNNESIDLCHDYIQNNKIDSPIKLKNEEKSSLTNYFNNHRIPQLQNQNEQLQKSSPYLIYQATQSPKNINQHFRISANKQA